MEEEDAIGKIRSAKYNNFFFLFLFFCCKNWFEGRNMEHSSCWHKRECYWFLPFQIIQNFSLANHRFMDKWFRLILRNLKNANYIRRGGIWGFGEMEEDKKNEGKWRSNGWTSLSVKLQWHERPVTRESGQVNITQNQVNGEVKRHLDHQQKIQ